MIRKFVYTISLLFGTEVFAIHSIEADNNKGEYDSSHYIHNLEKGEHLTSSILEEWIKESDIFSELPKHYIKVTKAEGEARGGGNFAEAIFFVDVDENHYVIRVASRMFGQETSEHDKHGSLELGKQEFTKNFNADSQFPFLCADLWTGYYLDKSDAKHYFSLMPRAKGIQLNKIITENTSLENRIHILTLLAQNFGKAHAATLLPFQEYKNENRDYNIQAKFAGFDTKLENIFIDEDERIYLIDLNDVNHSLRERSGSILNDILGLLQKISFLHPSYFLIKDATEENYKNNFFIIDSFIKSYFYYFESNTDIIKKSFLYRILEENKRNYKNALPYQVFLPIDKSIPCAFLRIADHEVIKKRIEEMYNALNIEYDEAEFANWLK